MFSKKIKNWAKTTTCQPQEVYYPKSEQEITHIIIKANQTKTPLKVIGKGHSYNKIFHPGKNGKLISLKKFNQVENIDSCSHQVTFQAGLSTPQLILKLKKHNLALSNLGTNIMDNFSGACSTGYHGSGIEYGIQSSFILSMDIITGEGKKLTIKKKDPLYNALGVGLGSFGVIIRLTIQCEPLYALNIKTKKTSFTSIKTNFLSLLNKNDHFKFIWVPHTDTFQTWTANRTIKTHSSLLTKIKLYFFDGIVINNFFHELLLYFAYFQEKLTPSINHLMASLLIKDKGEVTFSNEWAFFLPHVIKQDAIEYAIPIENTFDFFSDLMDLIKKEKFYVQSPIEVRFVKKDDFWMSPAYQKDVCYIGTKFHLVRGLPRRHYENYFTKVTELIQHYQGRPHWGKPLYMSKDYLAKVYPKFNEFWSVVKKLDPNQIFMNSFLKKLH